MNSIMIDPTETKVALEPTANGVLLELVDVFTIYYFVQATQTLPEHKVVTT